MSIEYTGRVKFKNGLTLYELQHHMENVADTHSRMIAFSRDDLMSTVGAFWVLMRLKICIEQDIRDVKEMDITTWHYKSVGVMWYRGFEFKVDGKEVGHAVSAWAIVDEATHHIVRPNHMPSHEAAIDLSRGEPDVLNRLKISDELPQTTEYKVVDEDIDINGHMNNARYTRLAETVLTIPEAPYNFEIDYISEAKKGDTVVLKSDGAALNGTISGKNCFSARMYSKY